MFHVEQAEHGGWYVYRDGRRMAVIVPGTRKVSGVHMWSNDRAFGGFWYCTEITTETLMRFVRHCEVMNERGCP